MPKKDIKVPNIGEFKDVEVIEIIVKKGQEILATKDKNLVALQNQNRILRGQLGDAEQKLDQGSSVNAGGLFFHSKKES